MRNKKRKSAALIPEKETALDVDAQTDIVDPVNIGGHDVAVLGVHAKEGGEGEQGDDGKYDEENGFFHFSHDLASCGAAAVCPSAAKYVCLRVHGGSAGDEPLRQHARLTITYYYMPKFAISQ